MRDQVLAGRYLLLDKVGEGGMGSVWRALDQRTGQDVAVKILRSKLCERKHSRRRFAREVQATAQLNHPGIVRILDHGEDGRPFLVMELLTGLSLRKYIRKMKPNLEQILILNLELCDALQHAHSKGIVHRDLKPDNVFVSHLGHVKILDFGLARMTRDPNLSALTRTGTALGTCSYMAPEQATGRESDCRADLYAMGVMLYEFLCGMTPFSADEPASILYMQVHQEPEHPCEVNPDLPAEVGQLILWLMNKNPENRPASASILREKIIQIINLLRARASRPPLQIGRSVAPTYFSDDTIPQHPIRNAVNPKRQAAPLAQPDFLTDMPSLSPQEVVHDLHVPSGSNNEPTVYVGAAQNAPAAASERLVRPAPRVLAPPLGAKTLTRVPRRPLSTPVPTPGSESAQLAPVVATALIMRLHKFSPAALDLPSIDTSRLVGEIYTLFQANIQLYSGRVLELVGNESICVYTDAECALRAIRTVMSMRTELEFIRQTYNILQPFALSAGIFTDIVSLPATSHSFDGNLYRELVAGANRLEIIARTNTNETIVNKDSLSERVICQPLRTIFLKNRPAPVPIYRVFSLQP